MTGIYAIINKVNNHKYIGSSINIKERWRLHILRLKNNIHHNIHLQRAWKKYGEESFNFIILLKCEIKHLLKNEQDYFKRESPEYNIAPIAGNTLGVIRSDEYRKKQSIAQKGKIISEETRKKISIGMMGKQNSLGVRHATTEETKEKIRRTLIGHIVSEETRRKIGDKNRGYKHTGEAKRKIGLASIGNQYGLGRIQPEEERKKRSESQKIRWRREKNHLREINNAL